METQIGRQRGVHVLGKIKNDDLKDFFLNVPDPCTPASTLDK